LGKWQSNCTSVLSMAIQLSDQQAANDSSSATLSLALSLSLSLGPQPRHSST
ncbi:unnamed protein product, partial [Ceratitis capitata]